MTKEEKREKKLARQRIWREANRERIRSAGREKYAANIEKSRAESREKGRKRYAQNIEKSRERSRKAARKRKKANPEKSREVQRNWRSVNIDKQRKREREYAALNAERKAINLRKWSQKNPEAIRSMRQRRRARLLDSQSPGVTPEQWLEIVETFDGRCAYCLRKGLPLDRDHVIPIKRGGRDEPDNVVPACRRCNSSKNAGILPLWYARSINEARL